MCFRSIVDRSPPARVRAYGGRVDYRRASEGVNDGALGVS